MADRDYLDYLLNGGDDEASYDTSVNNIDPSFDPKNRQKSKIDKYLEKTSLQNEKSQQDQEYYNQLFENQARQGPKERAEKYFNSMFKRQFGFTPDHGIKKVAGTIIDTALGFTFPGMQVGPRAQAAGQREYDDMTQAYKQLSQQNINSDKLALTGSQILNAQLLNQQKQEQTDLLNTERLKQGTRALDIKSRIADQGEAGLKIKAELAASHEALQMAQQMNIEGKTEDADRLRAVKEKWDSNPKNNLPFDMVMKLNPEIMKAILSTGQYDEMGQNYLNIASDLANLKVPKEGATKMRTFPEYAPGPGGALQISGIKQFPVAGGTTTTPYQQKSFRNWEKPQQNQQEIPGIPNPVPPKAKAIAQAITTPGGIPTPVTGNNLDKNINEVFTKPLRSEQITGNVPGDVREAQKNYKTWASLDNRQSIIYQNAASDLAKGDLSKWKGAINQNSLVKQWRAMTGQMNEEEITNDTNHALISLEHLKARGGGRVAQKLLDDFKTTLENKMDSPQVFLKRLGVQKLLIEMGRLENTDPRFTAMVDNFTAAYNKDPKSGASIAEAMNETIRQAIDQSIKTKRVVIPTMHDVFKMASRNLKSGTKDESDWDKTRREYGIQD